METVDVVSAVTSVASAAIALVAAWHSKSAAKDSKAALRHQFHLNQVNTILSLASAARNRFREALHAANQGNAEARRETRMAFYEANEDVAAHLADAYQFLTASPDLRQTWEPLQDETIDSEIIRSEEWAWNESEVRRLRQEYARRFAVFRQAVELQVERLTQ